MALAETSSAVVPYVTTFPPGRSRRTSGVPARLRHSAASAAGIPPRVSECPGRCATRTCARGKRSRRRERGHAVPGLAGGHPAHPLQTENFGRFLSKAQVPEVHRVEGAAHDADGRAHLRFVAAGRINAVLLSDLAAAEHDVLLRSETFEAHRAARMQLVGRNADLGAQAVFETVGESRG